MALLMPKRIIISRDPVKLDEMGKPEGIKPDIVMESGTLTNVHRKRKRLTHLSPEERLMRR